MQCGTDVCFAVAIGAGDFGGLASVRIKFSANPLPTDLQHHVYAALEPVRITDK